MLRNAVPAKFKPRGVVDSLDGMNSPPGAMNSLSNLIPAPSTPYAFQCRPAVTQLVDLASSGFTTPGAISTIAQINNRVYGLVPTGLTAGHDEPFSYNLLTSSFDTISGVTAANVPVSAAPTGEWSPASIEVMGNYVVFTHPGFNGAGNGFFGWLDISNPLAPVWHSGNTATNGLTGVPSWVRLFSNRLYFVVGNTLQFTDALTLTRTNFSQSLVAGDANPVTVLSLFSLKTSSQGGLQTLLAIKKNAIFQVTGDSATSDLAINALNTAVGTEAANSVAATPNGVMFKAQDGIRTVFADGSVSEPDQDLQVPFINALYPSRVSSSYNQDVVRICVQNSAEDNVPWQEFWFHPARGIWTGPHTFQQDLAVPWGTGFVLTSHLHPGILFLSQVSQTSGVSFTELGEEMTWVYRTTPVGEDDSLLLNSCNAMTLNLAFSSGSPPIACVAMDESKGVLSTAAVFPSGSQTKWNAFLWGTGIWKGVQYGLKPYTVPWTNQLVFTKMVFQATSTSSLGFTISNLRALLQPAGYLPASF